ncbi:hypothetical protein BGZ60DRAFT_362664 [Tricladium varicosporioides]|nr:hypothetical protein BGZ60DRAFT_362664 [Hymenoscyphus varicosporioides]
MADQDQASKDAAMKQRIIKHMNADHQESLVHYLQHFSKLSAKQARSPILTDISLESMTIKTVDGTTQKLPFRPPMKSFAEARTRTVDMDREAREGLNISNIKITEFYPPKTFVHRLVVGLCALAFTVFLTRDKLMEGSWIYENVLPWFPGGPKTFHWLARVIALPTLVLHLLECVLLDRTRLQKYGVARGSTLWWKYMAMCFLEGFGNFQRIDAAVLRKKKEAEKEKH